MFDKRLTGVTALIMLALLGGCRDDGPTEPAELPSAGEVFLDQYGEGVTFQAFGGSKLDAVQVDGSVAHTGTSSLRVDVPGADDPSGGYAGGAFTAEMPRDLTEFDALTFWARAATAAELDVVGLGNDNTETTPYVAEIRGLSLTSTWQRFVIPVPDPSLLSAEDGLFFFAEGPEGGASNTIWFDDVQFETLGTVTNPRPAMTSRELSVEVDGTASVGALTVTFDVAGAAVTVGAAPGYFTFTSSDETVATVDAAGVITVVGEGSATITAELDGIEAAGQVVVVTAASPATAAPTPAQDGADVISLFSDAYTDVTVDRWSTDWDQADVEDVEVAGDAAKLYTNLVFAGIEMISAPVDASAMTHFRLDLWTPDATEAPAVFRVKLVDAGPNGTVDGPGSDDSEHEVTIDASSTQALVTGEWVSLDLPLSDFVGLNSAEHIAQIILSGDPNTVYVDNVYFYDSGETTEPTVPTTAAPTPSQDAADVVSLFSDAYADVAVDRWSTDWDQADVTDTDVAGNAVKLYTNLVFAGIEMISAPVDASAMTHFRLDIWTPDATAAPAVFRVKLVDAGPNGTVDGPGSDDSEHEVTIDASSTPPLATGEWVSLDLPLSDFVGLNSAEHIAQIIISGDPNTVYVDNVYFHK